MEEDPIVNEELILENQKLIRFLPFEKDKSLFLEIQQKYPRITEHEWLSRAQNIHQKKMLCRTGERYSFRHFIQDFHLQNGNCYVCDEKNLLPVGNFSGGIVVDHNHSTGEVRKLLCSTCNCTLGLAGENPKKLALLSVYLQEEGNYAREPEIS
eukprot:TRINITY_DN3568_c0_g1_i1.p2 TRINITY_DN3568_c0_g1~~TRINITY_DN3568_c0_g1_i1.p2  ORF type:complete len:154 (-),score=25.31 TRINITY_DN3568_c0_g1_i1:203-664(-)